jgi:hypothetical protein
MPLGLPYPPTVYYITELPDCQEAVLHQLVATTPGGTLPCPAPHSSRQTTPPPRSLFRKIKATRGNVARLTTPSTRDRTWDPRLSTGIPAKVADPLNPNVPCRRDDGKHHRRHLTGHRSETSGLFENNAAPKGCAIRPCDSTLGPLAQPSSMADNLRAATREKAETPTGVFLPFRCPGSSGRTRTYNPPVNSRLLCRLSYRGTLTSPLYAISYFWSN